jgi:hypothetical protein
MHKPYPWTCGNCAEKRVYPIILDLYSIQILRKGKNHTISIKNFPIPTCQLCGSQWFSLEQSELIEEEYKRQTHV